MSIFDYCLKKSQKSALMKEYRLTMYYMELWEILMNQFEWKGLPDSIPAEWLEAILITNGTVGIAPKDGVLYCAAGSYEGALNGYIPKRYIAEVPAIGQINGEAEGTASYSIDGEVGKSIVVGWNNSAHSPEFDLMDTAGALTEGRTSEDINVIFSRLIRIPIARNSKEKAIFESAIRAILNGNIEAVSSEIKSLSECINENESSVQFLDLVDIKDVDKLQYLNQYMDNQYKRFMRRHGFSMNITSKLAQQTNSEMHGADDYSMIYPLIQLKYRQRLAEDMNRLYGDEFNFKASVEFGTLLKNNYDRVINYVPDELNEKKILTDTDEQKQIQTEVKEGDENEKNTDD